MLTEKIKEAVIRSYKNSSKHAIDTERIDWMQRVLDKGDVRARPSRYWEELNRMNIEQLKENGYENFKRTIALNYFTWTRLLPWDSQVRFLCARLPLRTIARCALWCFQQHDFFTVTSYAQSLAYNFLTLLEWEFLYTLNLNRNYLKLREPLEGNPILLRGGLSQDLANSILEFDSYVHVIPRSGTILELGGGYGRNAFVTLKLRPNVKYIFADIPPSLWVAERYLSSIFPEKKIMRVRDFQTFSEVEKDFEAADIVFLLSTQIEKLPKQCVDCIVTISSLHEMRQEQIAYYFDVFKKMLKPGGYFYFKQWKIGRVLFEGLTIREADYPVPFTKIFSRTARVQTKFFEALYCAIQTNKGSEDNGEE